MLIRRAARIAARASGGDLLAVHIARSDGLAGSSVAALDRQRLLVESLGGSFHSIFGDSVSDAVLDFAKANNATQIVIGASRRNPVLAAVTGPGTGMTITRQSGSIDVHVVSHDYVGKGRVLPRLRRGLSAWRKITGLIVALLLLAAITFLGIPLRQQLSLPSDMLLYLLAVVVVSLIGGFVPALVSAVAASLLLNYFFVPPFHRFTVAAGENLLALLVFLLIAVLVSRVVDLSARRFAEAARSNAEAETLSTLAGSLLRGEQALPALLERVRETFGVQSVSLLRRDSEAPVSTIAASAVLSSAGSLRGRWTELASIGDQPCTLPEDGDTEVSLDDELTLVLRDKVLAAEDQRLLVAFATQAAVAYRQSELREVADAIAPLAEADRTRTALLNAVSHDLRTPLAAAKAAVSSLRDDEVEWTEDERQQLLTNADTSLDRLTALVTNLLDLSRLQAGVLSVADAPVGLDDVVSRALDHLPATAQIDLDVPPSLPEIRADAGLLERVIANLVENALRYSPAGQRVRLAASAHGSVVELRVIDHGPGITPRDRDAVFVAFQRRDDRATSTGAGVGLGLAIARGFVAAMHGTIELEDTPGGGLMVVVTMPVVTMPVVTVPAPSQAVTA